MHPSSSGLLGERTLAGLALIAVLLVGFDWGGRLGRLRRDVESPDAEVRASAVRELADHPAPDVEALVLSALDDVDGAVRLDAADTAARLHLASAVPVLLGWLENEDEERRATAARALGQLTHPDILPALTRALSDPRADVRLAAIEGLRRRTGEPASAAVRSVLDDSDGAVRAAAARALGELGGESSVFALATHASDDAPEVRAAVASSLGALGEPRAGTTLRRLSSDPVADVRLAAALALGRLRLDEAVPELAALSRAVGSGEEREVAQAAIAALGRARSAESFAALADAGASPYGELQSTARAALEERLRLDREATRAQLVETLLHPEGSRPAWVAAMLALGLVRGLPEASAPLASLASAGRIGPDVALRALGHTGGDEALALLLVALEDAQRSASRLSAGSVLRASLDGLDAYFENEGPDGRASEPLIEALAHAEEPASRARIVGLLGRTASPRSAATLLTLLETEHDASLLRETLNALAVLDASTLDPSLEIPRPIEAALRHPDAEVRLAAARALGPLGDRATLDACVAALEGSAHLDRVATVTAIALLARRLDLDLDLDEERVARVAGVLTHRLLDEDAALADAARDALVTWGSDAALEALIGVLDGLDAADRRAPQFLLALGRFESPVALARLRAELERGLEQSPRHLDRLRAAALTIGERGDASDARTLLAGWDALPWPASAAASFSLARLARRGQLTATDVPSLCTLGALHDPVVRANVAIALAALEGHCDAIDPSMWLERPHAAMVRAAAARWLFASAPLEARRALPRCLDDLPPPTVEAACGAPALPSLGTAIEITAYELDGRTPARHAEVVLVLPDGTAMMGTTDASAHLFLANGPEGPLSLEEPSTLPLEP